MNGASHAPSNPVPSQSSLPHLTSPRDESRRRLEPSTPRQRVEHSGACSPRSTARLWRVTFDQAQSSVRAARAPISRARTCIVVSSGRHETRRLDVVATANRHRLRNHDPRLDARLHRTKRDEIVRTEHRGRSIERDGVSSPRHRLMPTAHRRRDCGARSDPTPRRPREANRGMKPRSRIRNAQKSLAGPISPIRYGQGPASAGPRAGRRRARRSSPTDGRPTARRSTRYSRPTTPSRRAKPRRQRR